MSDIPNKPLYPEAEVIRRFSQWTEDPSAIGERANLNWQMKGSNLELIVWTRSPADKGKPPIRANMNTLQAGILIDNLRAVAVSPTKVAMDISMKNMRRADKNNSDSAREMYDQAIVRVVKTTEGIVQIGVFDADDTRPRILFPFILDRWTGFVKRNGEAMSASEVSAMVAQRYATILEDIINRRIEMTTNTENDARYPKPNKPNGQFNKSSTSGSPRPAAASSQFEDITY